MSSYEWVTILTAIAFAIAKDRSKQDVQMIALLLSQLSTTLLTIVQIPPEGFEVPPQR